VEAERQKNLELSKKAFELVKDLIPSYSVEDIRGWIYDYGEWGLGVESIVDVLLEEDIPVTVAQKKAIVDAMDSMGLDRSQHEILLIE
jgi:hypothetical protein